jgi:hypothetical protein
MTPDLLITRYIDGDLTPEEDSLLRRMIAEDSDVKAAFEAAVLIHIAMSCEDRTPVPADLTADTLARVDAIADAEADPLPGVLPVDGPAAPGGSVFTRGRAMALLAALLMVVPVAHRTVWQPARLWAPVAMDVSVPVTPERPARDVVGAPSPSRTAVPAASAQPSAVASDQNTASLAVNPDQPATVPGSQPVAASTPRTAPVRTAPEPSADGFMAPAPLPTPLAVVFGTHAGTGIGSGDARISNVSAISQSIGYVINDGLVMGLEVGALTFDESSETAMQVRASTARAGTAGRGGALSKLDPDPSIPDGSTTMRSTSVRTLTRYWGTVFGQVRVLRTGVADVDVRGGLGADEAGFTGYGRVTGRTQVQPWLSASVGGEVRTFASVGYGVVFSAVFGIQISP